MRHLYQVACINVPLNYVFIIMYSSVIWMFNQLEGMQFSEVNRAVVTIEQLHLQPVAIHSEGTLLQGMRCPHPHPHPSTLITVAFTAAVHPEGGLPAGDAVPPAPSCSSSWCSSFHLNPFSVETVCYWSSFHRTSIFFPKLEFKGPCFVDRYGNMLTASPLLSISTLNKFQIFKLAS